MDSTGWDASRYYPPDGGLHYRAHSVIATVPPEEVEAAVTEVLGLGIDHEAITVVPADRYEDFAVLTRHGFRGFIDRLVANLGGDLDLVRALAEDMGRGRLLLGIAVGDDHERRLHVATVFKGHRGRRVTYLGPRAIVALDEEPVA